MPEKMKIVTMEHRPGHLFVELAGTFSLGAGMEIVMIIVNERAGRGHKKVLIDAKKMTGDISILDRYDLGQYFARFVDFSVKIALLCSPEYMLPDKFFENVVRNAGSHILVTDNDTAAAGWLEVRDLRAEN